MDDIIALLIQFPVKLSISKLFGMNSLTLNVRPAAKLVFGCLIKRIVTHFLRFVVK